MCRTEVETGRVVRFPFSGSRMIDEKQEEAAELGFPGRTVIVGSARHAPSMNPLRE